MNFINLGMQPSQQHVVYHENVSVSDLICLNPYVFWVARNQSAKRHFAHRHRRGFWFALASSFWIVVCFRTITSRMVLRSTFCHGSSSRCGSRDIQILFMFAASSHVSIVRCLTTRTLARRRKQTFACFMSLVWRIINIFRFVSLAVLFVVSSLLLL